MKKGYTRSLIRFSILILALCTAQMSKANCIANAHWTYTNPSGDSVAFAAVDTNVFMHHVWRFGDGTVDSSGHALSHVYANAGTYTVCLHVYYPNGCSDSVCQTILIGDTCHITAAWTSLRLGGDSVRFTAADTNSAATHIWNFGDNGYSFGTTHVTHHYASPGIYQVCFYSYRAGTACSDSLCQSVTVSSDTCGLIASWSSLSLGGDTLSFTSTNTDTSLSYKWNFGDGSYATGRSDTSHVYAHSGFYTACLYLHKPGTNCYDTICRSVSVGSNPCGINASWTDYTHGGDSVRFYAVDTNSSASHQWNFGDGNFASVVTNTSHHYTAPGTYHVCFYVYIPNTACSDSFCQNVTVSSDTCGLSAAWTTVNLGGDSLRFIATDTNSLAHHIWNFGDGTIVSGSTDTVHRYASSGTYHVCFYVYLTGTGCSDSICQTVTVGTPPCHVTAAWTSYSVGGDSMRFYASDTNSTATHIWNFGDGNYAYGTTATSHTYAAAGTYHVCFFAYQSGTSCSDSLCQNITISIDTCHITSSWSSAVLGGDSVRFYATDTISSLTYVWNFGDSTSDSSRVTTHTFGTPGVYHVCLLVSKPGTTCSDSLCQNVTVTAAPLCHITAAWTSTVAGNDSIHFLASDTNSAAHHAWNFGDGSTLSGTTNTIHHYAAAGTYTVCFYTYIPNTNCSDSLCRSVSVTGNAACNITANWSSSIVGNDSIHFIAADTNSAAHHIWKFGDGTSTSGTTNTIHHYASAGTYTVCFYTYIPSSSCYDSLCQSAVVTGSSPCTTTAAWTSSVIGTDSIRFVASDTNSAAHHIWNFGDGTNGTGTTVTHAYATSGNYTVCFYTYILNTNCYDSLCRSVTVPSACTITAAWTSGNLGGDSVSFAATDTNSAAHHIWNFGDGAIVSGTTHTHHTYGSPGAYNVCFYVYIPNTTCFDSLCQTINVVLGINNINAQMPSITVQPNPFSQYTLIKVDGQTEAYELNVYDLMGKLIRHQISALNMFTLERENLVSGMYMYEVTLKGAPIGKGKIIAE